MYEADPKKWIFVTGDKKMIYDLARKSYFAAVTEGDGGPGDFIHTENFVLVDKEGILRSREDDNGNIIGVYDGTDGHQIRDLIDDIKVVIAEYELALKKNNKAEK